MGNAFSAPMDEVMRLEIEIWSTRIVFETGEKLVLKVSGHSIAPVNFEAFPVCNEGSHVVYYENQRTSYIEVPAAPA